MLFIEVSSELVLHASEEELDTIVQATDGKDYVVIQTGCTKAWCVFNDNVEQEVEFMMCNVIHEDIEVQSKKKGVRGRPRKQVDSNTIPKKPRQPTAYNLFMKEKLLELSITHPTLKNKDRMKMASHQWNTKL